MIDILWHQNAFPVHVRCIEMHILCLAQQIKSMYGRIFQVMMQASNLVEMLSNNS